MTAVNYLMICTHLLPIKSVEITVYLFLPSTVAVALYVRTKKKRGQNQVMCRNVVAVMPVSADSGDPSSRYVIIPV